MLVKIILGRFVLIFLCYYTAIFAEAKIINWSSPLFVDSEDIVIFLFLKNEYFPHGKAVSITCLTQQGHLFCALLTRPPSTSFQTEQKKKQHEFMECSVQKKEN